MMIKTTSTATTTTTNNNNLLKYLLNGETKFYKFVFSILRQ